MDLAAQLELIIANASRLRSAGVQQLTVGNVSMVLAPPEPPEQPTDAAREAVPKTLLDDLETFGLPDGADLPGFRRPADLPRKA